MKESLKDYIIKIITNNHKRVEEVHYIYHLLKCMNYILTCGGGESNQRPCLLWELALPLSYQSIVDK